MWQFASSNLETSGQRQVLPGDQHRPIRRDRQCRRTIRTLAHLSWLTQRHPYLAEDTHVAFKTPQLHRVDGEALALQPAAVIDQHIGVGLLRTRAFVRAAPKLAPRNRQLLQ
jgi:hypothetical protein